MCFENIPEPSNQINYDFDPNFVSCRVYVTELLETHDVGANRNGPPVFINIHFDSIAAVAERQSFVELWQPSFISAFASLKIGQKND